MSFHPVALDFLPARLATASTECILMVLGEVRAERLEFLTHTIGDALAEHHGDDIGIGARAIRHDRGIHHP